MAMESPGFANQAGSYSAEVTRRAVFAAYARTAANTPGRIAGGLLSSADLQLSAPVSGLSVNVSTGECIIGGSEGAVQGGYYARGSSQTNLSVSAASPSNPRIDTVCATISDSGYTEPSGGSGDQVTLQVVTGTPTAGATLANLSGAATLPLSSLLLGYVLVPTSATNIVTADIANVAAPFGFQGISGPGVRGATNIATSESRTNTAYGTLTTPDQVTGIVLPTNGLIAVWYQATWQESVASAAQAGIFLNGNQLKGASSSAAAPGIQFASIGTANTPVPLTSHWNGLTSQDGIGTAVSYTGDVSTGQLVGLGWVTTGVLGGGPSYIFAAAGTYTVSVQFKATTGSVTASNRKLWVQVLSFA